MSTIQFLLDKFHLYPNLLAIQANDCDITYGELESTVLEFIELFKSHGIRSGDPVILQGDYSLSSIGGLLALMELNCIVIPITPKSIQSLEDAINEVAPAFMVECTKGNPVIKKYIKSTEIPELYKIIKDRSVAGLVLFTSGSSGRPKAVVHDFSKLLEKFKKSRPAMKTLNFLLFDHWGGLNTLLHGLSNLCPLVVPIERTPDSICQLIERYQIELLPATPGFLNMLLISRAYERFDLSSLRLITYGAEPMSEITLRNIFRVFPKIDIRQTYGMIELGVLRAKSRSPDSLWVKLGGEGYEIRIVDSKLEIKAESAMLGYLNAESPFTDDGYLKTGDLVECNGDWIRILGRYSDLINVGGQKVYPAEVEAALLSCPGVQDAVVFGESNPILGNIVCASIVATKDAKEIELRGAIKSHCSKTLQPFMVPMKIKFVSRIELSSRFKRLRT